MIRSVRVTLALATMMVVAAPAMGQGAPAADSTAKGQAAPAADSTAKGQAAPAADATPKKSLYERLGGQPAVEAVVKDFAGRCLADTRINKKFAKSDADRLVKNLTDFVCVTAGGPCKYTGNDMSKAHKGMGVTHGEFGALVEDLVATLDKFKVPAQEKSEVLAAFGPMEAAIVEDKSDSTGTALPSKFKPAKPLAKKTKAK